MPPVEFMRRRDFAFAQMLVKQHHEFLKFMI